MDKPTREELANVVECAYLNKRNRRLSQHSCMMEAACMLEYPERMARCVKEWVSECREPCSPAITWCKQYV